MTNVELIKLIEIQADARGISPATLCRLAVGNNRLLRTLQAGGSCTLDVAERFRSYVQEHPIPDGKGAAA